MSAARRLAACPGAASALALALALSVAPRAATARPVTFELEAPRAHEVFVAGEMTDWADGRRAMHRDADGRWRVTLDLADGQWVYKFVVDGQWIADPGAHAESDADGRGGRHSFRFVGDGDWTPRDVPHGLVTTTMVPSAAFGHPMKVNVWLPPGHVRGQALPVLWLLHGSGMDADQWLRTGRVDRYLDNLLAQGAIHPFAVVMPSTSDVGYAGPGERFIADELPAWLEAAYGVKADRAHSAVAGMSMGGGGALRLPLARPAQYGATVALSGYFGPELLAMLPKGELPMPAVVLTGAQDTLVLDTNHQLMDALRARGAHAAYREDPGAHTWQYWSHVTREMLVDADTWFATGRMPGVAEVPRPRP